MKIAALTYGCKTNQYETICILNEFLQNGWELTDFNKEANVYLINTCTVTNRTDYKSRYAIRNAQQQREKYQNSVVIVTGCYSQLNYQDIVKLGPVDYIIDNNHKNMIFRIFQSMLAPDFADISTETTFAEQTTTNMIKRSRAIIKIQDGCNNACAYCAVTHARGPSRSRERQNILDQVKSLVDNGYQEFVIAGVNLGLYGQENDDHYYLPELLADLENIPGVQKLRLSSLEPQLFTEDLMTYFRHSDKICHHFHIPLQSGSDKLLSKMGRNYSSNEFRKLFYSLLNIFPDAAIGIDVIAGLPGETEDLYLETKELLEELPFAYFHVFPYSKRPGTLASTMPDQVHGEITHQRVVELTGLSGAKQTAYKKMLIENEVILTAVLENHSGTDLSGVSDHYVRVHCRDHSYKQSQLIKGKPLMLWGGDLLIEVIP